MSRVRSIWRLAPYPIAVSALLLVSACGSPASQPAAKGAAGDQIRLVTTEWKFEPGTLQLPAGRPVTIVLENKGLIEHDIKADAVGIHVHAQPRQTTTQTVTLDKPGTYEFVCSIPGHKEAGMKGQVVVAK